MRKLRETVPGSAGLALLCALASSPALAAGQADEEGAASVPIRSSGETPAGEQEILVTRTREGSDEAIHAFVEALLDETGNGRIARWDKRICLSVEGVTADQSEYFADRISRVASLLGMDVRSGRCWPSVYIVFTGEPERLLQQLSETRPGFFGNIDPVRREAFRNSVSPVRWLTQADLRMAEGQAPSSFYIPYSAGGMEQPVPMMRTTPSQIMGSSRMDLQAMLVLVDASRLAEISYRSLSAYLTMVVLGNLRPDHGRVGQPSILNLFDPATRREGVTNADLSDWDLAYLASLYQGNWNLTAEQRTRRIQASMARNLERQTSED